MLVRISAGLMALVALFWIALLWNDAAGAGPASDCTAEAARLARDQSELPRLEFASPADRPPYCITLETVMVFAGRVKAHVAHCPNSEHAPAVADWDKTRNDYSKLFSQFKCKRTL